MFHHSLGVRLCGRINCITRGQPKLKGGQGSPKKETMHDSMSLKTDRNHTRLKWSSVYLQQERRRSVHKRQPCAMRQSPMARGSTADATHTPCHAAAHGPQSFLPGSEIQEAAACVRATMHALSRTQEYTSSWEQRKIVLPKAISSAQAMRALCLPVRKYSRLKPIPIWPSRGQKTVHGDGPSQHPTSWVGNSLHSSTTLQGHVAEEL